MSGFMEQISTNEICPEALLSYFYVRFLIPIEVVTPRIHQRCLYRDKVWLIDDVEIGDTRVLIHLWREDEQITVNGEDWREITFEKNGKYYRNPREAVK